MKTSLKYTLSAGIILGLSTAQSFAGWFGFSGSNEQKIAPNCPTDLTILMDSNGINAKGGAIRLKGSSDIVFAGFQPSSEFSITVPHQVLPGNILQGGVVKYPGSFNGETSYGTVRVSLSSQTGSLTFLMNDKAATPNDMNIFNEVGQTLLSGVSNLTLTADPSLPCPAAQTLASNQLGSGFDRAAYMGSMKDLLDQSAFTQQSSTNLRAQYRRILLVLAAIAAGIMRRRKNNPPLPPVHK